jgi:hypothetical protein
LDKIGRQALMLNKTEVTSICVENGMWVHDDIDPSDIGKTGRDWMPSTLYLEGFNYGHSFCLPQNMEMPITIFCEHQNVKNYEEVRAKECQLELSSPR